MVSGPPTLHWGPLFSHITKAVALRFTSFDKPSTLRLTPAFCRI
jgi:hypothetical protein